MSFPKGNSDTFCTLIQKIEADHSSVKHNYINIKETGLWNCSFKQHFDKYCEGVPSINQCIMWISSLDPRLFQRTPSRICPKRSKAFYICLRERLEKCGRNHDYFIRENNEWLKKELSDYFRVETQHWSNRISGNAFRMRVVLYNQTEISMWYVIFFSFFFK